MNKQSFKRTKNESIDSVSADSTREAFLLLRRENHSLKQELERLRASQHSELLSVKVEMTTNNARELKEREEEHQIIIEGLKTDYEERVDTIRRQLFEQQQRHDAQMREQQMIFECRLAEYRRQIEEMEREIDEMRRQEQIKVITPNIIQNC